MDKLSYSFVIIIAYIAPGFLVLYAAMPFSQTLQALLTANGGAPHAEAFLPLVLLSMIAGMVTNAAASLTFRQLYNIISPIKDPTKDIVVRPAHMPRYEKIIEYNFRYFECYNNLSMAFLLLLMSQIASLNAPGFLVLFTDIRILGMIVIIAFCAIAAYKTLYNYYSKIETLKDHQDKEETAMCGGEAERDPEAGALKGPVKSKPAPVKKGKKA